MSSFAELGLPPEVVEALAAVGIETPTPFQEDVIPVLRRGNNVVGRAGPGAGTLAAYGAPLLERLDAGAGALGAVVLAPGRHRAEGLAESLGRLGRVTGHRVARLGGSWALPGTADVLFASPGDLLSAVEGSEVKLTTVRAFVVDGAAVLADDGGLETVETLIGLVPGDAQRALISLPVPDAVEDFAERHLKRAVHVPPATREDDDSIPRRGSLRYVVPGGDREGALIRVIDRLLRGEEARHAVVFFDSADEAADVGDRLTLRGYRAGAPGDESAPVWLGVRDREVQELLSGHERADEVATVSYRVPGGPDSLDRRHGRGGAALVMALGRELPHLRETARVAGYELSARPEPRPRGVAEDLDAFRERIRDAVESQDLAANFLLLEPLLERHSPAEVAAALTGLLRSRTPVEGPAGKAAPADEGAGAWIRIFISLGRKDDVGPGDILGAITGEAGVDGDRVGRIDIKETFSLVEVDPAVASRIIEAMNGISVQGRSIRVDYDRKGPRGGGGSRRGG